MRMANKGLLVCKDRQTFDSYGETNDMLTEKFGKRPYGSKARTCAGRTRSQG